MQTRQIEQAAIVVYAIIAIFVTASAGLAAGVIIVAIGGAIRYAIDDWLSALLEAEELHDYAQHIGHWYEYSQNQWDSTVRCRAKEAADGLSKSGNRDFAEGVTKVHALVMRLDRRATDEAEMVLVDDKHRDYPGVLFYVVFAHDYDQFLTTVNQHIADTTVDYEKAVAAEDPKWFFDEVAGLED